MGIFSGSNLMRVLKPVLAGVGLAYMVTALVDGPLPVNFQSEEAGHAKQMEIVEPRAEVVIEKNIMKLGSLLSIKADNINDAIGNQPHSGADLFFAPVTSGDHFFKGQVASQPDS